MKLTIQSALAHAPQLTYPIRLPDGRNATFRPLAADDAKALTEFYQRLSPRTQRFYSIHDDIAEMAAEECDAIGKYDKLRLVLVVPEPADEIAGIVEFSFAILPDDFEHYQAQGIALNPETDARFGLCLSDELHGLGVGRELFPIVRDVLQQFGKQRIILWGGVVSDNQRAIAYYVRNGFIRVGAFLNADGDACLDMICDLNRHLSRESVNCSRG